MITVFSEKHRLRDAKTELAGGVLVRPFECPERAEIIHDRVQAVGLGDVIAPTEHPLSSILTIHDPDFVRFLQTCWDDWKADGHAGEAIASTWPGRTMRAGRVPNNIDGKIGYYAMAAETAISDGTWQAVKASADVALTAVDHVIGGARSAFALCRPPGHHAASDLFGGYCFVNNAAIAAQKARDAGVERVAILDVDFHHGNGTQAIFYDRGDVLFTSIHGDPRDAFPYFLGFDDETGTGEGEGCNLNIPLPPGTPYATWANGLEQALDKITQYAPGLLIISLGVDTFALDPISFFKLQSDDFTDMGQRIEALGLPTLFVMEGGYAVAEIGVNAVNVLTGFEGR